MTTCWSSVKRSLLKTATYYILLTNDHLLELRETESFEDCYFAKHSHRVHLLV